MPIKKQKEEVEFAPPRTYTSEELEDFHNKCQKYWVGNKFLHEELHCAYGAATKEERGQNADGQPRYIYLYHSERYQEFANLWSQYETWRVNREYLAKEAVAF